MYQYAIEHVKRVRNGDTFDLIVDLGFGVSASIAVRLDGAETAEYGTFDRFGKDEGLSAREFAITWFKRDNAGPYTLNTVRDRRGDYYGTIYDAQGMSLADALVEAELARIVS